MKNVKKSLVLLTSLLCTTALASCSNGGGGSSEEDPQSKTNISIFMNDWEGFKSAVSQNSPIYKKISDKTKVKIECQSITGEPWQAIASMEAAGTLTDIFITRGPEDPKFFKQLIKNKEVVAISDYVKDDTTYPNLYKHMKQFDFIKTNISYANGKSWFIPSAWHNEKSLYVRQDWIDNLNAKLPQLLVKDGVINSASEYDETTHAAYKYKIPETILDFYYLARAFKIHDPDNNGQDDTYGYVSESNKDMDAWAYIAFDAGWNQWIKDGNTYVNSNSADGAKKATALFSRLNALGYAHPDNPTNDNGTKQSLFATGRAGMMYAHNWYNNIATGYCNAKGNTPEVLKEFTEKVKMVNPPKGPNGTFGGAGTSGYWEGFCINAKISDSKIKKILKFYDYLMSNEGYELLQYGVEGTHYTKSGDTYTSLIPDEPSGLKKQLRQVDAGCMLYALVDWTMDYKNTCNVNANIIVPQHKQTEKNASFEDYPSVVTTTYIEKYTAAKKIFQETINDLESTGKGYFSSTYDESKFDFVKDCTWDLFNGNSKGFEAKYLNKWNTYVDEYMDTYKGTEMQQEYNAAIATCTKASKDTYWYRPYETGPKS